MVAVIRTFSANGVECARFVDDKIIVLIVGKICVPKRSLSDLAKYALNAAAVQLEMASVAEGAPTTRT